MIPVILKPGPWFPLSVVLPFATLAVLSAVGNEQVERELAPVSETTTPGRRYVKIECFEAGK